MYATALIVLPPGDDTNVKDEVRAALEPYHEDWQAGEYSWWDWYRIGDRWSPNPAPPNVVLAQRADDRGRFCWTIVAGEVVLHRAIYHPDRKFPDCYEPVEDFDERVVNILRSVHPESRVVTIDYHS